MTSPRRPQSGFAPERLLGHLVGGAFKLLRVVGTGGTATVYEAQELGSSRRCAVKVLHPNPNDQSAGPRFVREGEIAQRVMGPHSVEIIRAGKMEGGQPFLVMEFLEGEDLAARLEQRGRLAPGEVVSFVVACAAVLERAHAAGIIHRDLKPANVFYAKRAQGEDIKLLDFGAAKDNQRDDKLTAAGQVVGTPWYMSPEQARGQGLDARSDEFSLAIIAYQALGGRVPFDAPRPTDVLFKIVSEPLPPLTELAADVQAAAEPILQRALAKKAADRFASVQAFAEGLKSALGPWSAAHSTISVDLGVAPTPKVETADDELGMVLLARSMITEAQLNQAQALARKEGGDLADALLRQGAITETKLLSALPMPAHWRPTPSERIRMTLPPDSALALVSADLATRLRVVPFGWTPIKGEIRVFAAFPAVPELEAELKRATKAQKVAVYVTSPGAVHAAIRRWYHNDPTAFTELLPSGAGPRSPIPPTPASAPAPASPSVPTAPKAAAPSPPAASPVLAGTAVEQRRPSAPGLAAAVAAPTPKAVPVPPTPAPAPTPAAVAPRPAPTPVAPAPPASLPVAAGAAPAPAAPQANEWRPPVPPPAPSQARASSRPNSVNRTTGEFDLLQLEGEPVATADPPPAPVAEEPPVEPRLALPTQAAPSDPPEVSTAEASEPAGQSLALNAATAAYPIVNDVAVVPYLEETLPPPLAARPREDAATSSYPIVEIPDVPAVEPVPDAPPIGAAVEASSLDVASVELPLELEPVAPPVEAPPPPPVEAAPPRPEPVVPPPAGHGDSLVGMTGSFSIVVDEPAFEAAPPPQPALSVALTAPELRVAPPAAEDFAVDVTHEPAPASTPEDDIAIDDDEPAAGSVAGDLPEEASALEVVAEEMEVVEEVAAAHVIVELSGSPRGPPPAPPFLEAQRPRPARVEADAEEVDADSYEVEEEAVEAEVVEESGVAAAEEASADVTVEPGVAGVRIESTPGLAHANGVAQSEAPTSNMPVAKRPTQTDVRPLADRESLELGLGELSEIQTPVASPEDPAFGTNGVASPEPWRVLAAPDLVRQALGRIGEIAQADRVALVMPAGDTFADPASVPPLFARAWVEYAASSLGALTLLGPDMTEAGGGAWFEGATSAAAMSLALGEAGVAVLVLRAQARATPFGIDDRPLLAALARQLARVFSVAQAPARDRLDLEAWLAGERHLSSLVDRSDAELRAKVREAVVLCIDARPWVATMGDAAALTMFEGMNELVEDVSRAVYAHGGLLERVQGDSVVAVWGALADGDDDWATEALSVAEVVQNSKQARVAETAGASLRIGLHAARVTVGPVGLQGRRSLCVVGPASAIGFRLSSLGESCAVVSVALLERAGLIGPEGPEARFRRIESPNAGVEAYAVQPSP